MTKTAAEKKADRIALKLAKALVEFEQSSDLDPEMILDSTKIYLKGFERDKQISDSQYGESCDIVDKILQYINED